MKDIHLGEEAIRRMYCELMEEAKLRLDALNAAYNNEARMHPAMARELCYLQLRFLCEVVAIGCLVAHGEMKETHALRRIYEPGKIIKQMTRLNPHFYPQPIERTLEGRTHRIVGKPDKLHLTRKELPTLWGKAGDVLHRSPMVKLFQPVKDDLQDVFTWGRKISGLLDQHLIALSETRAMIVSMVTIETGRASATILDFSPGSNMVQARHTWAR